MKRNIVKQTLIVALATVTIAAAAIAAPVKKKTIKRAPASSAPKVSFIVNGKLMTQSVNGGAVRAATAAEKNTWRSAGYYGYDSVSPNRQFRVNLVDKDADYTTTITRIKDGKIVLKEDVIDRLQEKTEMNGYTLGFNGWLPDSRHIVLIGGDGGEEGSGSSEIRAIFDIFSRTFIRFTGVAAPNMKVGIVPNTKDTDYCYCEYLTYADHLKGIATHHKFYAVNLPANINNYRFSTAPKKMLTLNGKPFGYGGDVTFSKDSQWAVIYDYEDYNRKKGYYLASVSTGKVRKLPGIQARFTN